MPRRLLNIFLCITVACLGASGVHVHVSKAAHEHGHVAPAHGHAHTTSAADADHDADHAQSGDIDVEPVAKAFGKLSVTVLVPVAALLSVLIPLLSAPFQTLIVRVPPLRPPKGRLAFYFLPPSHAPPVAALPR